MSGPQFRGGASAATKKQFLKGTKKPTQEKESTDRQIVQREQEILDGAFRIEHPIDTCVGPIGQFIMEPESFPKHPSILFYGKRRTGKSYSARWILFKCFSDYPFGICCTGTYYNGFWQQYIPDNLVFDGLDDRALTALIKRQVDLINKWRKDHPNEAGDAYKDDPALRAFIILGKQPRYCNCIFFEERRIAKELAHNLSDFRGYSFVYNRRRMPHPE